MNSARGLHRFYLLLLVSLSLLPGGPVYGGERLASEDLRAGMLLVAKPHLNDPRFQQSVILLADFGRHGAWGVVINKPTKVLLSELYPQLAAPPGYRDVLFWGGPVSPNQRLLLVGNAEKPSPRSLRLAEGLYLSGSRELFEAVLQDSERTRPFRVMGGYAGWAPGQLEIEYAQGDWFSLPATTALIFDTAPEQLWEQLMPGRLMQMAAWAPCRCQKQGAARSMTLTGRLP